MKFIVATCYNAGSFDHFELPKKKHRILLQIHLWVFAMDCAQNATLIPGCASTMTSATCWVNDGVRYSHLMVKMMTVELDAPLPWGCGSHLQGLGTFDSDVHIDKA